MNFNLPIESTRSSLLVSHKYKEFITNSELRPSVMPFACESWTTDTQIQCKRYIIFVDEIIILPSASGWCWKRQRRRGTTFVNVAVTCNCGNAWQRLWRRFARVMFRLDTLQHQLILASLALMNRCTAIIAMKKRLIRRMFHTNVTQ